MDKYPENDFITHFKTVFDEYEDSSADEGWLKLREKYPEEEQKKFLLWSFQGMAASFILFLLGMTALYFMTRPARKQPEIAHSIRKIDGTRPADLTRSSEGSKTILNSGKNGAEALHAKRINSSQGLKNSSAAKGQGNQAQGLTNGAEDLLSKKRASEEEKSPVSNRRANSAITDLKIAKRGVKKPSTAASKTGAGEDTEASDARLQASAPGSQTQSADELNQTDRLLKSPLKASVSEDLRLLSSINPGLNWNREPIAIHSDFAKINEDDPMLEITWTSLPNIARERKVRKPALKSAKKIVRKQDPFELGLFAGSYENYAKGSSDHTSVGGGVSGDIPLFKNIKLSTGLSLNPTAFDFNADESNLNSTYAASVPAALNVSSLNAISYNGYEASLLGLDVPLNLKYTFHLKKHYKVYVAAGVSSSLLLNQSYSQHYSAYSADAGYSGLKSYSVASDVNTGGERISNFNFAGLLNLSAGFGYPLGKTDFLVIEPFLKYPLHTPVNQSLPVSYGGVNLRFNFSPGKP